MPHRVLLEQGLWWQSSYRAYYQLASGKLILHRDRSGFLHGTKLSDNFSQCMQCVRTVLTFRGLLQAFPV